LRHKLSQHHGPGVNNVRGYHICDECKRLMREAEAAEGAAYDAIAADSPARSTDNG
jgi:hypothetical protein